MYIYDLIVWIHIYPSKGLKLKLESSILSPISCKGNWSHVQEANISHVTPLSLFVQC